MKSTALVGVILGLLAGAALVAAESPLPYLECPVLNYFAEECPTLPAPPPAAVPEPPVPPVPPEPLFTRDNVAKDTPQLMLDLLNAPKGSVQEQRLLQEYLAWNKARMERAWYVEMLMQQERKTARGSR